MADHLFTHSEITGDTDLPPAWRRAEMYVIAEHDLYEDHGPEHDACDDDGKQIEIKSCVTEYSNGRPGEFYIWEDQVYGILGDGRFTLLVYLNNDRHSVIATHTVDPLDLTDVGTVSWVDHETMGTKKLRRIPWPDIVPLENVDIGARHYFAGEYPKEVVENTFCLDFSDGLIRLYL